MEEVLSPLAPQGEAAKQYRGSMIDYNVRAERIGWLPSAPQLQTNPLQVVRDQGQPESTPRTFIEPAGRLPEDEL